MTFPGQKNRKINRDLSLPIGKNKIAIFFYTQLIAKNRPDIFPGIAILYSEFYYWTNH